MAETVSRPLLDLYPNRGLIFTRGEGVHLYTRDGTPYLDLMTNYGVSILGHGHPAMLRAIGEQSERLITLHGSFGNEVRTRAAVALVERLGMGGASICWTNSGAEAIEAALKFAAVAMGRTGFVACEGGYHGKTLGAQVVTHGARYREGLPALLSNCRWAPFGDPEAIDAAIGIDTAAVVIEPIQGEGGIVVPPDGFLLATAEVCRRRGVLLIVDEIQTGCGRTGAFTASGEAGIVPDILCLGKGLAGGIPVGATVVSSAVAVRVPRGAHTSTFGGNPLAAAGVLAVLDAVNDELLTQVRERGARFREGLTAVTRDWGLEVRGRGLMIGVVVGEGRDQVLKALQRERVLAIPAGKDVVRFLPPYVAGEGDLTGAARAFETALGRGVRMIPPA